MSPTAPIDAAIAKLCLQCGLCCNGVLFKDVELQPGDDPATLKRLGIPLTKTNKFPQPCVALNGCECRIYANRPTRCRQFECALLKSVVAGDVEIPAALRIVRETQRKADKVKRLLRELGDTEETRALSLRFKRMQRRFNVGDFEESKLDIFGDLTLAVHELNLALRTKFYP
jgi:uncharacterized protein